MNKQKSLIHFVNKTAERAAVDDEMAGEPPLGHQPSALIKNRLNGHKPVVVLDLEFLDLPPHISVDPHYGQAFCLVRLSGLPVDYAVINLDQGKLFGEDIRRQILYQMDWYFWEKWLNDRLEWNPAPIPNRLPSATIAVCTRDRPDDLWRCLEGVMCLPDVGQELVVIDSCSATDSTRRVVDHFPSVRYYFEEVPGLNRARNRACLETRTDFLAFIDDDAVPDKNWLNALLRNFQDPRVLCVTGLTMPIELETKAQQWFEMHSSFGRGFGRRVHHKDNLHPLAAGRVGAGVNMALSKMAWEALGMFDEALDAGTPTHSGGDTEMFARLLGSGYQIVYDPAALSWHRHRREWKHMRKTLFGYGSGVYSFWTRQLLLEGEWWSLLLALNWAFRYQIPSLIRSLLGFKSSTPLDLQLAELAGCISGPFNYLNSLRKLRRRKQNGAHPYKPIINS